MFLHDLRFWALGGPCIAVLLLLGGRATALVASFGVMACYCFDLADNAVSGLFALFSLSATVAAGAWMALDRHVLSWYRLSCLERTGRTGGAVHTILINCR